LHEVVLNLPTRVGPTQRPTLINANGRFPQIVKKGIPGTGMAAFGQWVTDDEVKAMQAYLRKRATDSDATQ